MTEERIVAFAERRLKEIAPSLKPEDRVRWLWGYHDALEDIVNASKGEKR